jgi:kynurenine formamidase
MAEWAGRHCELDRGPVAPGPVRVYDLAQPLEPGMPRHPAHPPFAFVMAKTHGQQPYAGGITAASELIAMGGHVGTHIDALGHVAHCGEIYDHRTIADAQTFTAGLAIGSVEEIPPLIGRGHLIDAEELFGRELTPADGVGPDELESWFAEHPAPEPGSVVLVRTGWLKYWNETDRYLGLQTGLPGVTRAGAQWLSGHGIVATGSDTMNYEQRPPGVASLVVHVHLLVERGIYIMESMNLEVLASDGVRAFEFFAAPLRIRGATGSPIRPLAIVSVAGGGHERGRR